MNHPSPYPLAEQWSRLRHAARLYANHDSTWRYLVDSAARLLDDMGIEDTEVDTMVAVSKNDVMPWMTNALDHLVDVGVVKDNWFSDDQRRLTDAGEELLALFTATEAA